MGAELSSQTNGNFALAGRGACDPGGRDETGGRKDCGSDRQQRGQFRRSFVRQMLRAVPEGGLDSDWTDVFLAVPMMDCTPRPSLCVASPTTVACMQLQ
jgi:hypothetical protein